MYQKYYHLSGKPFRLSPDPNFFFPSRGHKRALAYLRYGLNQDEGFVVITGAPGTGKTTLAKILLQELGDKNLVVAHLTTTQLEADDMLRMVAASFGLRYENQEKAALLKSLEQFLLARARERKRALLVIDEAQNLPERSLEELRMLSNLQIGDKALVQTFLLGQAQFRQMLDHADLEQLRQRVIANYHLSPLAPDECQRYIESRLQQVGWTNDPYFAEVAYEMIHGYTEGIPRRINMLCDRILLFACMEELHDITGEVVSLVIKELENEISGKLVSPADQEQEDDEEMDLNGGELIETVEDADAGIDIAFESTESDSKDSKHSEMTHAQRLEEFAEKYKSTSSSSEGDKIKETKVQEGEKITVEEDSQVMGNTVTKTKPDSAETSETITPAQTEIDERDLFRVIPGGKSDQTKAVPDSGNYTRPMAPAALAQQPSQEDVALRRILRLVLAFHRSPSRFPGIDNANQPLPDGITELLELAISDDQTLSRVSPAAVMGISPMMLRAAVRFFVRRAFFVVDGDDYRALGLQPGAAQSLIERHYDLLMRLLRQDKQRGSADSVARIGSAYETLSRLDQAAQAQAQAKTQQAKPKPAIPVKPQPPQEAEIEEEDDLGGELTIDFEEINKITERRASSSAFGKKPYEVFNPETAKTQRRLRYVGQMLVLGFGALVIVLGMYIVQLEPSDDNASKQKDITVAQNTDTEETTTTTSKHLPLSVSDGSSTKLTDIDEFKRAPDVKKQQPAAAPIRKSLPIPAASTSSTDKVATNDASESAATLIAALDENPVKQSQTKATVRAADKSAEQVRKSKPRVKARTETKKPKAAIAKHSNIHKEKKVSSKHPSTKAARPAIVKNPEATPVAPTVQTKPKLVATVVPQSYPGKDVSSIKPATSPVNTPLPALTASEAPRQAATVTVPSPAVGTDSATQQTKVVKLSPQTVSTPVGLTERELNTMLSQFEDAYQRGDINKIMGLFAPKARTNSRTTLAGIRTDYFDLFKTTNNRKISIDSVLWDVDGLSARGVGDFRVNISNTKQGLRTYTGKVTIQASKRGSAVQMTRFYFSNQKTTVGSAGSNSVSANNNSMQSISKIEMQNLITQFIQYYEQGDIDGLMSLFANDAHTNDRSTKAGIRKDYVDLFNSTQTRQFTMSNMSWKTGSNNIASGLGHFEVVVKGKGSDVFHTYTGTIKAQARRTKGRILITSWVHNTH